MSKKLIRILFLVVCCSFVGMTASCESHEDGTISKNDAPIRIGIAWRGDTTAISFVSAVTSIREAGCVPVLLPMLKSPALEYVGDNLSTNFLDEHGILLQEYADMIKHDTYKGVNIPEVLCGLDAVVFSGGADICPTLYRIPEPWHGIEADGYDARRDVSDYMLMAWLLERDTLPVLCICRGMQMLSVVSGASMIQDIPSFLESQDKVYHYEHRQQLIDGTISDFAKHDVVVLDSNSLIGRIVGIDTIYNVPSWHHQAVLSVESTPLRITAVTPTEGFDIIESLERTDKRFFLGIQFHPEVAVQKHVLHSANAADYMPYDEAILYFLALKQQASARRSQLSQ